MRFLIPNHFCKMKWYIFSVVSSDWDTCIWFSEDFKTAYQLLYKHLTEYSDNTYIDMYKIPNDNIEWVIVWWEFQLEYCWQTIFIDDYESMNIEYHCILEWTCTNDLKGVSTIAQLCDLSFIKD